ncbi:MAG: serine/threonine-protein kinase [Acidobacteriota bacterium]
MEGQSVSKYEVIREIGRGGMGVVFQARDPDLRRDVALKVLSPDRPGSARRRRRLVHEARAASGVDHPGIVTVFDIVRHRDSDVIVMELVEGRTLRSELVRCGRIPWARAVRVGLELADAMAAAHRGGVVHRDLKPENIMLGSDGAVKVLDFGLATLDPTVTPELDTEETILSSVGTDPDIAVGTVAYMAPEQALGEPVDGRADVFAFGVVLYEMLCGRRPFRGATALASLQATVFDRPASFDPADELPTELQRLIAACLEKRPAERPPEFDGIARTMAALVPAAEGLSAGDGRPSTWPGASLLARPRRWVVGLTASGLGTLAIVSWIWIVPFEATSFEAGATARPNGLDPAPRHAGDRGTLAEVPATAAYPASLRARRLLERYDRPGHIDQAIEILRHTLVAAPDLAIGHAALSEACWRKYRVESHDSMWLDRAESHAQQALELDDHLAVAHLARARVWVERGDTDAATEALAKAELLDPLSADVFLLRARILEQRQELERAELAVLRAIEIDPANREALDSLGTLLFRRARYEEAEAAFRRSLAVASDSYIGHRNLAGALQMQGRHDEAASQLQRSLEIRPTWSAYTNLGTLQFFRGLYGEAVSAFEKAIELGANGYLAWANLGDAYRFSPAHRDAAPTAYRRAIQLAREQLSDSSTDAELRSRIALYHAKAGEGEAALAEMGRIDLGRADATLLGRSILVLELVGRRSEAIRALERALGLGYPLEAIQQDPELEDLRRDPQYHKLLARS